MADKYHGKFIMDEIVFYSEEIAESFIKQIEDDYDGHITGGFDLKNIINKDKREKLKRFKIKIRKDNNNDYFIRGSGLRTWIWEFESYIRSAYDAHKIVCYKPKHWVTDMIDSIDSLDEDEAWEKKFAAENAERYKAFKLGEFAPPEREDVKGNEWKDGIKVELDSSGESPVQQSPAKGESVR